MPTRVASTMPLSCASPSWIDTPEMPDVAYHAAVFETHEPYRLFVANDCGVWMTADFATWTDRGHLLDAYVDACVADLAARSGEGHPIATTVFFHFNRLRRLAGASRAKFGSSIAVPLINFTRKVRDKSAHRNARGSAIVTGGSPVLRRQL